MHTPRSCMASVCLILLGCQKDVPETSTSAAVDVSGPVTVTIHDQTAMMPGTTIFGLLGGYAGSEDLDAQRILEVDANGKVLWEYLLPESITPSPSGLMDIDVLDNGNILFSVMHSGIFEVNREGTLVWEYRKRGVGHDSDRLSNGNVIFVDGNAVHGHPQVVEIDASGATQWTWTGTDDIPVTKTGDEVGAWLHPTSVMRMDNGSTFLCLRNQDLVVEILPSGKLKNHVRTRTSGWATDANRVRGFGPHGCVFTKDNQLVMALRRPHRVVSYNLINKTLDWSWQHPTAFEQDHLYRNVEVLGNGNILVVERNQLVEINPEGKVVWEMFPPALVTPATQDGEPAAASVHLLYDAVRIPG